IGAVRQPDGHGCPRPMLLDNSLEFADDHQFVNPVFEHPFAMQPPSGLVQFHTEPALACSRT
ncbi:MAG: hypothetical protein ABIN08_25575, partial [Caldimonas sp.]